jgi:hypothetical protein
MNITTPVIHELGSAPSRHDSTRRVHFVYQLSGRSGHLDGLSARGEPLVQPLAIVAAEEIAGSAM